MRIKGAIALTLITFLVVFWLPNLSFGLTQLLQNSKPFNSNYAGLSGAVFAQEEASQVGEVNQSEEIENLQESLEEAKTLEEALEIIEDELTVSESQYAQAYLNIQNGSYRQAEVSLKSIISKLVNPRFQKFFEDEDDDECKDAPGFIIRDLCRVAPSIIDGIGNAIAEPFIRFTERLFLGESDFEYEDFNDDELQAKLIDSAERAHNTAVNSIRLLQKAIISGGSTSSSRMEEALAVAELGRELEFVRLAPLLSDPDSDNNSGDDTATFSTEPPEGMSVEDIRETVEDWGTTAVYFSVISPEEIFIWVIPQDRAANIAFHQVNLRTEALISNALRVASSYIDRGNSDKGQVVAWSRSLRSLENDQSQSALVREYYGDRSPLWAIELRLQQDSYPAFLSG